MAGSKFAGIFSQQQEEPKATKKQPAKTTATISADTEVGTVLRAGKPVRTKPLSKTQDHDWKGFFVFLKKETHTEANYLLRKQDAGEDFSDLMERLLSAWLKNTK